MPLAIQDQLVGNYCWGCGADNPAGLRLKSRWTGAVALAQWTPRAEHAAGPRHVLNGGIIATLLDCHGICTALADAYDREGREIGTGRDIWYATASLAVEYLRPTPIEGVLELVARVVEGDGKTTSLECVLSADAKERARATVAAVRVPDEWRHGGPRSGTPAPRSGGTGPEGAPTHR